MKVTFKQDDLLKQNVDAIVNPANATGYMGYGAAKAIVKAGGKEIEDEAVAQAPLIKGDALATTAGKLPFKAVIHSATIDNPNNILEEGNISKAVLGALLLADDLGYKSIAIPGMGTGVGGVDVKKAAEAMLKPLGTFEPFSLEEVVFVDLNEDMVKAWERAYKKPDKN